MKWQSRREWKHGEEHTYTFFALLPYRCCDGTTRWLERVKITQRRFDVCGVQFWDIVKLEPTK